MTTIRQHLPKGWALTTLDKIVLRMSNGANVKQFDDCVGHPITRIETIWDGRIDLDRVKYISENDPSFIEKYKLEEGDILFSHINSDNHLGKTALYSGGIGLLIHGINLLLIRPSRHISSQFLNYQFQYLRHAGAFVAVAQRAVNQSSINQKKLKSFDFFIPPREEQTRMVEKIDKLFSMVEDGERSLQKVAPMTPNLIGLASSLRKSILNRAFRGNLVSQSTEDEPVSELLRRVELEKIEYTSGNKVIEVAP